MEKRMDENTECQTVAKVTADRYDHWQRLFVTFEPSQLTVKSNEVLFFGFLCYFLCPLEAHERK